MKKVLLMITVITVASLVLTACRDIARSNPMDPDGDNYAGITYYGEEGYSSDIKIISMDGTTGTLIMSVSKTGYGSAVMRGLSGAALENPDDIQDACTDGAGNLYYVDETTNVNVLSPLNVPTTFPLTILSGIDKLYIEHFNSRIYVSGSIDQTIVSYMTTGTYVDSISITVSANGYFTPDRIFSSANYIYVVNALNKSEIARFDGNLAGLTFYYMPSPIVDGCFTGTELHLLSGNVAYTVDDNLNIIRTWGNIGEGPGRVFNGTLMTHNSTDGLIYILDGTTLKKFGE